MSNPSDIVSRLCLKLIEIIAKYSSWHRVYTLLESELAGSKQ